MKYTRWCPNDFSVRGHRRPQPGRGRGGHVLARAGRLARAGQPKGKIHRVDPKFAS
jgi:hypothetical protein